MRKPILCLDFDGVIHSYESGWKGAAVIPDPPVPGAMKFLVEAAEHFTVAVYSSRSGQPGGIDAMKAYISGHIIDFMPGDGSQGGAPTAAFAALDFVSEVLQWPTEKPPALVTIDDRAVTFTGAWPAIDDLLAFKPWNKK